MIGIILLVFLLPAVVGLCRVVSGTSARAAVVAVWLGASILVGWAAERYERDRSPGIDRNARPVEHREDGYLSSRSCKACHPHHHATWDASYHPRMTDPVNPETVVGTFDGEPIMVAGERYRLERFGDDYWAEFPDPDQENAGNSPNSAPKRVRKQLVMSTGSHHMQVYWYETGEGRTLGQLPIVYLNEAKRWIPRMAAFLSPDGARGSETGAWKTNCITCHTTGHKPGLLSSTPSPEDATRVAEFGIGCEACHGPGEAHAQYHRDPLKRYPRHFDHEPDPSIVQPERLNHQRSSEVCGQCHGVNMEYSPESFRKWLADGNSYRPGDTLADTQLLVCNASKNRVDVRQYLAANPHFWPSRFWPDGMVRVSGREFNGLVETPCFQRGELSCISCHNMHQSTNDSRDVKVWANDQLKSGHEGNRACTQCHQQFATPTSLVAHTRHPANSTGSQCYNCHMPHTSYGLLKAIRSHEIDSPDIQTEIDTGRPNACNLCHLDQTLEWSARNLHEWYSIDLPPLTADQQKIAYGIERLTRGDAGQRALVAWSMGWQPAQEASGSEWMAPYLALTLKDPYVAVRYLGGRSLQRLPGFEQFDYDFLDTPEALQAVPDKVILKWARARNESKAARRDFHVDVNILRRLLSERDNSEVYLNE